MPRFERITLLAVALFGLFGLVRAILGPAPPVLLLLSPLVWAVAAGGVVQGLMVFEPLSESEAEGPNWMAFALVVEDIPRKPGAPPFRLLARLQPDR